MRDMDRGSRKHVLDWTGRSSFLQEMAGLVDPIPVRFPADTKFVPRGHPSPQEVRLGSFGPDWSGSAEPWGELGRWWLRHAAGANPPHWGIAVGCQIEDRPGLILVEAKVSAAELRTESKRPVPDSLRTNRQDDCPLANRLAFTSKLATLGFPVVLVYLGFTGDEGIAAPFVDDADWQSAFDEYLAGTVPQSLFERRREIGSSPVWLLCRSRQVLEISPAAPGENSRRCA